MTRITKWAQTYRANGRLKSRCTFNSGDSAGTAGSTAGNRGLLIALLLIAQTLTACTYSSRVKEINDLDLCDRLGSYVIQDHKEGIEITRAEIERRQIDKNQCAVRAEAEISKLSPEYKLKYCQELALFQYKGAYQHFKATADRISALGFGDHECLTMAEFYLVRLSRKQEKSEAISSALNQFIESTREQNKLLWERLYGPGTSLNPIHIKID